MPDLEPAQPLLERERRAFRVLRRQAPLSPQAEMEGHCEYPRLSALSLRATFQSYGGSGEAFPSPSCRQTARPYSRQDAPLCEVTRRKDRSAQAGEIHDA